MGSELLVGIHATFTNGGENSYLLGVTRRSRSANGWLYLFLVLPGFLATFIVPHLVAAPGAPKRSKYYPGPMLLNFSVGMGTGVSNMAQAAEGYKNTFR